MKTSAIAAAALVMMVGSMVQADSFYPITGVTSDTAGSDFLKVLVRDSTPTSRTTGRVL